MIERDAEEWKARLGLKELPLQVLRQGGENKLKALGVAGFINIGGVDIEIKPKFLDEIENEGWRRLLWNMLSLTDNYSNNIYGKFGIEEDDEEHNFLDVMGWTFLNSIRESISEGLPRGYVEKEGYFSEIRGSIDYSRIKSILERPFVFPCRYDEYNEDIPLNRLLKWAGIFLSERVKSFRLSNMLAESTQLIGANNEPPGPIEAENLILPAQFNHAEVALNVAKILLKQGNYQHKSSELKSFGFLWKSHQVYEDFLFEILRIAFYDLSPNFRLQKQCRLSVGLPHNNTTTHNLIGKPDFIVKENDTTVYILDAKYKTGTNPKASDINQIIVACKMDNCLHGILLFPSNHTNGTYHKTWKINSIGYPKYVSSLYVNLERMSQSNGEYTLAQEIINEINEIKLYI